MSTLADRIVASGDPIHHTHTGRISGKTTVYVGVAELMGMEFHCFPGGDLSHVTLSDGSVRPPAVGRDVPFEARIVRDRIECDEPGAECPWTLREIKAAIRRRFAS